MHINTLVTFITQEEIFFNFLKLSPGRFNHVSLQFSASNSVELAFQQCCRNEHEQMNINKHDKQTKHKPTPAALFVRERSPTLVCPFNFSHRNIFSVFLFFFQHYWQKKQKEAKQAKKKYKSAKSGQSALT